MEKTTDTVATITAEKNEAEQKKLWQKYVLCMQCSRQKCPIENRGAKRFSTGFI